MFCTMLTTGIHIERAIAAGKEEHVPRTFNDLPVQPCRSLDNRRQVHFSAAIPLQESARNPEKSIDSTNKQTRILTAAEGARSQQVLLNSPLSHEG
jgi:hypothetical protein